MKGQPGTQVKDASHFALGNPSLEQRTEREGGSGVWEVQRGGVAPASHTSGGSGEEASRESGQEARRAPSPGRPRMQPRRRAPAAAASG